MSFLDNDPSDFLTWRELMKMKLALFMFAIGLGSSFAYAADTSGSSCHAWCYSTYNKCVKNTPRDVCMEQRDECLERCGNPP
jgi:hypothetical protein